MPTKTNLISTSALIVALSACTIVVDPEENDTLFCQDCSSGDQVDTMSNTTGGSGGSIGTTGDLVEESTGDLGSSSDSSGDSKETSMGSSTGEGNSGEGTSTGSPDPETTGDGSSTGFEPPPPPKPVCGNYVIESGEQCDDGNTDSSDACTSTCQIAKCGDGVIRKDVELCDDGNTLDGDGCHSTCSRWDWNGIAKNVELDDMVGWKFCLTNHYGKAMYPPVDTKVVLACPGKQIAFACYRNKGNGDPVVFDIVAHAPLTAVTKFVNLNAGERSEANGVAWGWAPHQNFISMAPSGYTKPCMEEGSDDQLCWRTAFVNMPEGMYAFQMGGRCGSKTDFTDADTSWHRIVMYAD